MNPLLLSGLVLAGANRQSESTKSGPSSVLTAEVVSNLELRGTELVVLSACESGLGVEEGGEGMMGLRRAFLAAGAAGVVASLWPVPDQQTRDLMVSLSRKVWEERKEKGTALREAQIEILAKQRKEFGTGHPEVWGAFTYWGWR